MKMTIKSYWINTWHGTKANKDYGAHLPIIPRSTVVYRTSGWDSLEEFQKDRMGHCNNGRETAELIPNGIKVTVKSAFMGFRSCQEITLSKE